jgi:hypothetical protein
VASGDDAGVRRVKLRGRERWVASLGVAFLAHAGAASAVLVRAVATRAQPSAAAPIDVEIAAPEMSAASEAPAAKPDLVSAPMPSRSILATRSAPNAERAPPAVAPPDRRAAEAPAAAPWTFNPIAAASSAGERAAIEVKDLGLRLAAKATPRATNGAERLKEELKERDEAWRLEFGIGAGGVVRVAEDAARRSELSHFTSATLEIDADAEGRVVQARAVNASSDQAVWNRIAQTAFAGLRVDAAHGGRGVHLVVRVDVALKMPSGTTVREDTGARGGILSALGDLSDVGARPVRVVSAHLVSMTAR